MTYAIDQAHKSPNHNPRGAIRISMIVLHATVGSFDSALNWLCSAASRVSSHYLIRKDGFIAQLVADDQVAWHAGRASWHGVTDINERSLGIELENANDGRDPYPAAQLAAAHWLCQAKIARYNIEKADVVRHLDVAMPRGRKTDPAGFPWPTFVDSLYLDPASPPQQSLSYYRVKAAATAGAKIRSAPRTNAAVLGALDPGAVWEGKALQGSSVTVQGFGTSDQWVRSSDMRWVWANLLEEIPHRG